MTRTQKALKALESLSKVRITASTLEGMRGLSGGPPCEQQTRAFRRRYKRAGLHLTLEDVRRALGDGFDVWWFLDACWYALYPKRVVRLRRALSDLHREMQRRMDRAWKRHVFPHSGGGEQYNLRLRRWRKIEDAAKRVYNKQLAEVWLMGFAAIYTVHLEDVKAGVSARPGLPWENL